MLSEKARRRLHIPRLPLEDVLDLIVRTEAEPDNEVSARWRRHYPEYDSVLSAFFIDWQLANFFAFLWRPEERAKATAQRVLHEFRYSGCIPSLDHVEALDVFEAAVLAIVAELDGKGHRESITQRLSEDAGTDVLPTATAAALDSLEKRSLIWTRVARRKADPAYRRRPYFTITLAGKRALKNGG